MIIIMQLGFDLEVDVALLCGKGLWLKHSFDLQRAAECAAAIGISYLLVKTGHGPVYFPETAHILINRIRSLGYHPLAWMQLTPRAMADNARAVIRSLDLGYEAVVIYTGDVAFSGTQVKAFVDVLDNVDIPRQRVYLATPPLAHIVDKTMMKPLVSVAQGGWMPLCFGQFGDDAAHIVDRDVYHALGELSLLWDKTPDVYPVISPAYSHTGGQYLPEEFAVWIQAIANHGVDFFSVFHAENTEKALWPMLKAVNVTCAETAERAAVNQTAGGLARESVTVAQPVFITATASDTVWGLISRYGLTKTLFWEWNAHLWDERSLPRDGDYMQAGWRIRVK